jgi:hypothetical protein
MNKADAMLTLLWRTVLLHQLQTNYTNYSSTFQLTRLAIRVTKFGYWLATLRLINTGSNKS